MLPAASKRCTKSRVGTGAKPRPLRRLLVNVSHLARQTAELVELKQTCRNRVSAKAGQSTTFLGKEITDYEMDAIVYCGPRLAGYDQRLNGGELRAGKSLRV